MSGGSDDELTSATLTWRILLFLSKMLKLRIKHVPQNGELKGTHTVRLCKALYGLKSAPRLWFHHIHQFLMNFGFEECNCDSNLLKTDGLFLLLYVDDIALSYDPSKTEQATKESTQGCIPDNRPRQDTSIPGSTYRTRQ
jgi:hypothetical protein